MNWKRIKKFLDNGGRIPLILVLFAIALGIAMYANFGQNEFRQACHDVGGYVLSIHNETCIEQPIEIFIGLQ